MKSDNISKLSESNPRTILCTDDNNNSSSISKNCIRLKYSDHTYSHYDISTLSCINPIYFARILNQSDTEILLPRFITPNLLMEFLFIIKNGFNELDDSTEDNTTKIISILNISEFFQNESISIQLIRDIVLNKLTPENSFIYLQYSYDKLNKIALEGTESEGVWFDLFYKCLETIGTSPFILFKHNDVIGKLDTKVIYELLQKCFAHLVLGNYILIESETFNNTLDCNMSNEIEAENYFDSGQETSPLNHSNNKENNNNNGEGNDSYNNNHDFGYGYDHYNIIDTNSIRNNNQHKQAEEPKINFTTLRNLAGLIQYLYKVYHCPKDNFFDLITYEYMSVFSNDSLRELTDSRNPTFQIDIPYDFDNFYYKEYTIDLMVNKKRVILVVFYQQNDDSFNVCIKLGDKAQSDEKFCFQIFSFISIVKLNDGITVPNSFQSSFKSLSNNKSMHCIMKFPNFKSTFKRKRLKMVNNNKTSNCNSRIGIDYNSNEYYINNDGIINSHHMPEEEDDDDLYHDDSDSIEQNNKDYFTLKIYLKLCFIHSVLSSFLLQNFNALAYKPNINKLSKQMIMMILKNKYLNKKKEDDILSALINWLDDEINIKEDITELFDLIHWKDVTEELLFEFVMKYAHMISIEDYDTKIVKGIEEKYHKNKQGYNEEVSPIRIILIGVYTAAKKVDYNAVYTKMQKEIKMSLVYKRNGITDKGTINTEDNFQSKENTIPVDNNNSNHSHKNKNSNKEESHFNNFYNGKSNENGSSSKMQCYNNNPSNIGNLYKSKDVNTLNKFIVSHCSNNINTNTNTNTNSNSKKNNNTKGQHKRNNNNDSLNNMPSQSNQSLSLCKVLITHNVDKNKSYKHSLMKYQSCQGSAKNYSAKKISHLKQYSLQIQTDNALTQNTKKNLINLQSAATTKSNNHQIQFRYQTNPTTANNTSIVKGNDKSFLGMGNDKRKKIKIKQNSFINTSNINNNSKSKLKNNKPKSPIMIYNNKQCSLLKK